MFFLRRHVFPATVIETALIGRKMHFSQEITNIRTSRFMSNHRQRVCQRMVNSVCHSDAQGR
jgi:hypothetical protein